MVITREKENMNSTIYGANEFDPEDPVNLGVLADDLAGYSTAALRRIHYRDPNTGKDFVFITTCNHLRPGVIALLYFMRWKIEQTYDVFKNKFKVRKARGTGETSTTMQAHFVALLHNLLTLLLAHLEKKGAGARRHHQAKNQTSRQNPRGQPRAHS
jgi:hypothetical protein